MPIEQRWTRRELRAHVAALGLAAGDSVMLHAGLRSVGPMLNGPDALIGAILDVVTDTGTLLVYTSWDECYEDYIDADGRPPESLRADIPPFDAQASRACRDHGAIAEFVRTWPGALRSGNPGASCAAVGARAEWFTRDHPLDYGYGDGSPFDKLVQARGKVLMVGAPLDTMTLLHHAEHRAAIPGKRIHRVEVPLRVDGGASWRLIEEFDTSDPVVEGLRADYFADIVDEFLADSALGRVGAVGAARAVLVPAAEIVEFAVRWLEHRVPSPG
jgi:aminoglycoside 3-N-acetyltransferase